MMTTWRRPLAAISMAALMLAACGQQPQSAAPVPADRAGVGEPPATPPPASQPQPAAPFYVGRWAAAETACGHAFWEITEQGLATSGGVSCRFTDVKPITTGFEAAADCTGPEAAGVSRIRFAYAQSAKALLVDAEPWTNVGLIACPH